MATNKVEEIGKMLIQAGANRQIRDVVSDSRQCDLVESDLTRKRHLTSSLIHGVERLFVAYANAFVLFRVQRRNTRSEERRANVELDDVTECVTHNANHVNAMYIHKFPEQQRFVISRAIGHNGRHRK